MDFTKKNVVITGGSSGIGLATAKAFINNGAKVWITGRNNDTLQKVIAEIDSPNLKAVVSDTSDLAGISVLEKAIAESGRKVDVLFLNAGTAVFAPIEAVTEADFDTQFNTNVKGSFFTLQKLLPHLAHGASVLFTSSTNATTATLNSSVYSASKRAVNAIANIAANELADRNVRVNIISPGPTDTPGLESVLPAGTKEVLASTIPLKRIGRPEEVVNAVLFLSLDGASFISGTELVVDGGFINYALK